MRVFDFNDHREYLKAIRNQFPGHKKPINFKKWAKLLGYRSPRSVEMILQGERSPSLPMMRALARHLKWSDQEYRYFSLLVSRDKLSKQGKPTGDVDEELKTIAPSQLSKTLLDDSVLRVISEWHHIVIKQLATLKKFKHDSEWIADNLRSKISPKDAELAIQTLLNLKVLTRHPETKALMLSTQKALYSANDVPSKAVRAHHKQMMERAAEALEEQGVLQRHFVSLTVKGERSRVPEIKKRLQDFIDELNSSVESEDADGVFQFNIQFFEHTR